MMDLTGMDLDQLADDLAAILKEEIDWEVLSNMLVTYEGWTSVHTPPVTKELTIAMREWADNTCTDSYREYGPNWVFKSESDATIFAVRWC